MRGLRQEKFYIQMHYFFISLASVLRARQVHWKTSFHTHLVPALGLWFEAREYLEKKKSVLFR